MKIREMRDKDTKFSDLKAQVDRNDRILKKHMDENAQLKRQMKSGGGSFIESKPSPARTEAAPTPVRRDFKQMRAQRKEATQQSIEEFNQKFLNDLQSQIDGMLSSAADRKLARSEELGAHISPQKGSKEGEEGVEGENVDRDQEPDEAARDREVKEKEKMLAGVREFALSMSTDIKDLLKDEWTGTIKNLEGDKKKEETSRKDKIEKARGDAKQIAAIEREHQLKMDNLNIQVSKLEKEKQKKEESVAK